MAKKTINLGSGELAGDGESIRSALSKVNENFDELYAKDATEFDGSYNSLSDKPTIPTDTGDLTNNAGFITSADVPTIPADVSNLTDTTNLLTDLSAVSQNIVPTVDSDGTTGYSLGSASFKWKELFVSTGSIYIGDVKLSNTAGKIVATKVINPGEENEAEDPEDSDAFSGIVGGGTDELVTFTGEEPTGNILVITANSADETPGIDNTNTIEFIPTAVLEANEWLIGNSNVIVTFANNSTATVTGWNTNAYGEQGGFVSLDVSVNLIGTDVWPMTFATADYSLTSVPGKGINVNGAVWKFDENGKLTAPGDIRTGISGTGGRFIQDCGNGTTSIRWINAAIDESDTQIIRVFSGDPGLDTDNERAQVKLNWLDADRSGLTVVSFDKTDVDNIVEHNWDFQGDGGLKFPDATIQTTAYTGQGSATGYMITVGSAVNEYTYFSVATVDSAGGAYYCGSVDTEGGTYPTVVKVNASGTVEWQTTITNIEGTIGSAEAGGGFGISFTFTEINETPVNRTRTVGLDTTDGSLQYDYAYNTTGTDIIVITDSVLDIVDTTPFYSSTVGHVQLEGTGSTLGLVFSETISGPGFSSIVTDDQEFTADVKYYGTTTNPNNRDVYAVGSSSTYGPVVSRFDFEGTVVWHFNINLGVEAVIIATSVDYSLGYIYVTSYNDSNGNDGYLTKMDATTGEVIWQQAMGYTASGDNEPFGINSGCVVVDGAGNIVTAWNYNALTSRSNDILIVKFDTTGAQLWQRSLGTEYEDFHEISISSEFLTADSQHYYLAVGAQQSPGGGSGGAIQLPLDGSGVGTYGIWLYAPNSWTVYNQDISAGEFDITSNLLDTPYALVQDTTATVTITPFPSPTTTNLVGGGITTGDITFAGVKIIGNGTASGDGNGYGTIELVPDNDLYDNDQYLIIDPTEPGHIHVRAGGTQDASSAYLFLGGEQANVLVRDGNHTVAINTWNGDANNYNWNFNNDGSTDFPVGLTLSAVRGPNTVNFTSGVDKIFQIETQTDSASKLWTFDTTGTTTLPGALVSATVSPAAGTFPVGAATAITVTNSPNANWTNGTGVFANGINFAVAVDGSGNATVSTISDGGTGNFVGDTFGPVVGTSFGGATPADDMYFEITAVATGSTTALDLTKQTQILTAVGAAGAYSLANGVEGQIMYFVPSSGVNNGIYVLIANARIMGEGPTDVTDYSWTPFSGETLAPATIAMAIFADGAWCLRGGATD